MPTGASIWSRQRRCSTPDPPRECRLAICDVGGDELQLACMVMSGGITLIDRTDRRMLPIGDDGFSRAARRSVIGDKAMPITSKHRRSPLPGAAGPLFLALPAGRGVILARNRTDCMGRRPQSASRGRKYDVNVLLSAPSGRVPASRGCARHTFRVLFGTRRMPGCGAAGFRPPGPLARGREQALATEAAGAPS